MLFTIVAADAAIFNVNVAVVGGTPKGFAAPPGLAGFVAGLYAVRVTLVVPLVVTPTIVEPTSDKPAGRPPAVKMIGPMPEAVMLYVNAEPSIPLTVSGLVKVGATGVEIVSVKVLLPVP